MTDYTRYTVGANGTVTADAKKGTITDVAIDAVTSPFKAFSSDAEDELITRREAGLQSLMLSTVAVLGGEFLGHKRAAKGSKPLIQFWA